MFEVGVIDAQKFDLLPTEWLHSSVSIALHRQPRDHEFESRLRHLNLSGIYRDNCLNCPDNCEDHFSKFRNWPRRVLALRPNLEVPV